VSREEQWERRLDKPLIVASLLVIPAVVLTARDYGPGWSLVGSVLNWVTWLAFAAEVVIMLAVVDDRRRWMRDHPLELAVAVLSPPILPGPLQSIRILRLLRLLRLLRAFQIFRRLLTPAGVRDAAILTLLVILAGGVGFGEVESTQHLTAWDGVWWAMSTITTVGYGDVTPHTTAGRVIGIGVMVAGIGFVALITASIAQRFVLYETTENEADATRDDEILAQLRLLHEKVDRLERRAG